jgi:hypothetical protein
MSGPARVLNQPSSVLFNLATTPARWLSRVRPDLRFSLEVDAVRYRGAAAAVFAGLALVAVAYPIAASVAHMIGPPTETADSLLLALRPFFDVIYSESIPFMVAAVGIGLFSPALGVLLVAVFIPADFIAASNSPLELYSNVSWNPWPVATLARVISWLLLWILAVEIPLRTRDWAAGWASRGGRTPSSMGIAGAQLVGVAVLVFLWARALPFLIEPVFTWSLLAYSTRWSTDPTWYDWQFVVLGAAAIGVIAALWPGSAGKAIASVEPTAEAPTVRTTPGVIVRQLVAVVVLVALFAGLLTTVAQGVVLAVGLLVAGPVLTLVLPRVRVPAALASLSPGVRWIGAMAVSLAIGVLILILAGNPLEQDDPFMLVLALAIIAPVFRFLLDAGSSAGLGEPGGVRRGPPPAAITTALVLLVVVAWLALPAIATADDCSNGTWSEVKTCPGYLYDKTVALLAAAAAFVAAVMHEAAKLFAAERVLPPVVSDLAPFASEDGAAFEGDLGKMFKAKRDRNALSDAPDESMGEQR